MIDFTTFFAKTKVERLSFKTRREVNYQHEVIFLSSYLHDARFSRSDFVQTDGKITVRLERDCWEFCTRIHQGRKTLLTVPSILTISGIDECYWNKNVEEKIFTIRSVFIGERQYLERGKAHMIIDCPYQDVRIDVIGSDDYFDISLDDQADPE